MAKLRGDTTVAGSFGIDGATTAKDITATSITATGTVKAQYFDATSSREAKKDIKVSEINGLDIIDSISVVDFRYKSQNDDHIHTGFIAEDTSSRLTGVNGKHMSMADTIGVLIKAVQELNKKIEG